MNHRLLSLGLLALLAVGAGCKKHNQIPSEWQGRYRRTAMFGLIADQFVVVGSNSLRVENCQVNCGEAVIPLTSVNCTGSAGQESCAYTSTHCTGTVSVAGGRLYVTAQPTATSATGPALGTHNQTCWNVRGNGMTRAQ